MTAEIVGYDRLDVTLDRAINALSPAGRKKLLTSIARRVAAENRNRIAANITPEGTAFAPRKARSGKKPRARMFARLRTARWLKTKTFPSEARIFFTGGAAAIAAVHHYGLRARIERGIALSVQYPARPLLGLSDEDKAMNAQDFGAGAAVAPVRCPGRLPDAPQGVGDAFKPDEDRAVAFAAAGRAIGPHDFVSLPHHHAPCHGLRRAASRDGFSGQVFEDAGQGEAFFARAMRAHPLQGEHV